MSSDGMVTFATDEEFASLQDGLSSVQTLEQYREVIDGPGEPRKNISAESFKLIQIGMNEIKAKLGYVEPTGEPRFSLESFPEDTITVTRQIAVEGVKDFAKKVWDQLVKILKTIKDKIASFFRWVKDKIFGTKKQAEDNKKAEIPADSAVMTEKGEKFDKGVITVSETKSPSTASEADGSGFSTQIDREINGLSYQGLARLTSVLNYKTRANLIDRASIIKFLDDHQKSVEYYRKFLEKHLEFVEKDASDAAEFANKGREITSSLVGDLPSGYQRKSSDVDGLWESHYGDEVKFVDGVRQGLASVSDNHFYLLGAVWKSTYSVDFKDVKVHLLTKSEVQDICGRVVKVLDMAESFQTFSRKFDASVESVTREIKKLANQEFAKEVVKILERKVHILQSQLRDLTHAIGYVNSVMAGVVYVTTVTINLCNISAD